MKKSSVDSSFSEHSQQLSEIISTIIFDSGIYMAWMSGNDALLSHFNNKWLKFTGQSTDEETGYGWTYSFHPDDLVKFIYKYINAFNRRREFKIRFRLRKFDGAYYWIFNHGWPVVDNNDNFLGYIGLCELIGRDKKSYSGLKDSHDKINGAPLEKFPFLSDLMRFGNNNLSENNLDSFSSTKVTKREKEIIRLIIKGYRNKQIALKLKISTNTVRNHIFNIFNKFNVSNRVQLFNQIVQPKL